MLKTEPRPVLRTVRNFRAIDTQQFKQDVASLAAAQLDIAADQFNTEMRRLLDTHAPSTQRDPPSSFNLVLLHRLGTTLHEAGETSSRETLAFHWTDNS